MDLMDPGLALNSLCISKKSLELLILLSPPPSTGNILHHTWFSVVLAVDCGALNKVIKDFTNPVTLSSPGRRV